MLWKYYGQERPPFAEEVGPGQESVWDYPRPPVVIAETRRVRVESGGRTLADSVRVMRLLETASAPGIYVPREDVDMRHLRRTTAHSLCEWKGEAEYFDVHTPAGVITRAAWSYPDPSPKFAGIAGYISFYPDRLECYLGDERVVPQPGGFYGGWVTSGIAGPVKGEPGTGSW
jgi:uncharacterized protein (DUF427 family)